MYRDIRKYVRSCESCMKYKTSQLQVDGRMLTQVPEETMCADFADLSAVETRKFDAVGPGGQILKVDRDRSYEEAED
ncbi:GM26736 [Drosophila sechellia]|uniref:GM26736 n=1 Tax=Drosophila sechellia TaxID=7238 RepID=B4IKU6_DROSE|nr:GM26736 [Drosophila sechellia]